jgi:transposase InsO family protein
MSLARLVVTAVRIEGRTKAEVSRDYGVSPRWVYELCRRFDSEGEAGLEPRSRRPRRSPQRVAEALEDEIVELRKALTDEGLDAGAHTIAYHLTKRHGAAHSVATIWRILSRRGFVTPQPQKRPRSSFVRFEAAMPNERWQADITHWRLGGGKEVEILNVIDDHSRFLVASDARATTKAADVVGASIEPLRPHGFPASLLSDNGAVFTAAPRGGRCAIEIELDSLGISYRHSSPYHPQTCGKVERFHQTLKRWLARQEAGGERPRAPGQARPLRELLQRGPAAPGDRPADPRRGVRSSAEGDATAAGVRSPDPLPGPTGQGRHHRHDHASPQSRLHHIGLGRRLIGTRVLVLVADLDVRVLSEDGELIRRLTLDPARDYQPHGRS